MLLSNSNSNSNYNKTSTPPQYTLEQILAIQAGVLTSINDTLVQLKDTIQKTYGYGYERGTTYAFTLNLTGANNGGRMITIDFIDPNKSRNIGQGQVNVPNTPVARVLLYNSGAGEVGFSTNQPFSSTDTSVPLPPNSAFQIDTQFPSIHSLNLLAISSDSTVKVVLIV